jgi:pimeloyl-ACP methyl ester carboxylesterase
MARLLIAALLSTVAVWAAEPKIETGEINGASFRIDVPEPWTGGLIMYCHGYSPSPGKFTDTKSNPILDAWLEQGFAVAESGYAAGGWAIEEATEDTQALLRYFARKYGAPKETYVAGHSMGGFLTMVLLERFPNSYDGGLALCGPLAPAAWFMRHRVFDMRVVFDYYFPGALPPPDKVPGDWAMSPALNDKVQGLLDAKPEASGTLRRFTGIRTNKELAGTLVFFTYILKDLQHRGGGNAFDNRNIIYEGTGEDDAVNDGVKRYAADPRAAEYVRTWYTPTGRLERPMLAIHTTYDPLVPPETPNQYQTIAELGGGGSLFVQQYVKHAGHCSISPAEVSRGLSELREWSRQHRRPAAGQAAVDSR